jgi:WD40 repeat protein
MTSLRGPADYRGLRGMLDRSVAAIAIATAISLPSTKLFAQVPAEIAHGVLEDIGQGVPGLEIERELMAKKGGFTKVVWSSDSTKLAAYISSGAGYSDFGNLVTVWDHDGQLYRELGGTEEWLFSSLSPLAFAGRDRQLVVPPPQKSNDSAFSILDIDTGAVLQRIPGPALPSMMRLAKLQFAVSPDQSLVAVANGAVAPVTLYSASSGALLAQLSDTPRNEYEAARLVTFSADGRFLAWNRGLQEVLIYNLADKRLTQELKAFSDICCIDGIVLNRDGTQMAANISSLAGQRRLPTGEIEIEIGGNEYAPLRDPIRVLRTKDGSKIAGFPEPVAKIRHLEWTPDGRTIAFTTDAQTVRLWDPANANDSGRTYRVRATAMSLAFSPDGLRLAIANGRYISIFQMKRHP